TALLFFGLDEENAGRGAGGTPSHGFTNLTIQETTDDEFTPLDGTLPFLGNWAYLLRANVY
ncbi:hypothetical protein ABFB09_09215, partial [Dehalogenimonas sp. THU2]|uniref:hypothetical protein n=1 Tax=Dehalogenimonas sp. THU2 TaxID=3151121 RepID=UPI003218314F